VGCQRVRVQPRILPRQRHPRAGRVQALLPGQADQGQRVPDPVPVRRNDPRLHPNPLRRDGVRPGGLPGPLPGVGRPSEKTQVQLRQQRHVQHRVQPPGVNVLKLFSFVVDDKA
jgi:hypothetical protein